MNINLFICIISFAGLGEAKICATEMWRKYSEEYDASRARTSNINARTNFISPNCKKMKLMHDRDGSDEPNYASPSSSSMKIEQTDDTLTNHGFSTFWNIVSTNDLATMPSNDNFSEDNSIDEHSTAVEEENYEMRNLFPCVDNMNISHAEKINILVQRKDNNFFLDVPESSLVKENPRIRPFKPLNRQDYQTYIFSEEGQIASAATVVYNINEPWSTKLQCMLELSCDEGFTTWADAKEEILIQLQKHLSQNERRSSDIQDVHVDGNRTVSDDDVIYCSDEDVHEDLRTQTANNCSVQAFPVSSINDNHIPNLPGHLLLSSRISRTNLIHDETIYGTNTWNATCSSSHVNTDELSKMKNFQIKQETPIVSGIQKVHSMHKVDTIKKLSKGSNSLTITSTMTSLDTPKHSSAVSVQRPTSTGIHPSRTQALTITGLSSYPVSIQKNQSDGPSKKSHIDGVSKDVMKKLWNLRKQLSCCCRDNPLVSWHDKLRPHLPLIRSQLGETYTLPTTVSECMADLVLVLLHQQLSQT